jgi:hypothetical protein
MTGHARSRHELASPSPKHSSGRRLLVPTHPRPADRPAHAAHPPDKPSRETCQESIT